MNKHIPMPLLTPRQKKHLWSKIISGSPKACWPCTNQGVRGYSRFKFNGSSYIATRLAYHLTYNQDPGQLFVCHSCDNPACCNPAHLWLGTCKENIQDSTKKGRRANLKGTEHGRAKFTEDQIREIRRLYQAGGLTQKAMGKRYGVAKATIYYIVNYIHWAHVEDTMPVQRKQDSKGGFYQWGNTGAKYRYTTGDAESRKKAEKKAQKQGAAIRASGYK